MMKTRALTALALVCATLGCEPSGLIVARETADFETMRTLWVAQELDDYYVEYTMSNAWVPPYVIGIEVRDGEARRVRGTIFGEPGVVDDEWRSPSQWERGLVIDSLYARFESVVGNPALNVETRFDTRIGLLTFVSYDDPRSADEEYAYAVRRFVRQ